MIMNTGRKTTISISERACVDPNVHPGMRRAHRIIVHDGYEWQIGNIRDEKDLEELLNFLEIELTDVAWEAEWQTTGKIVCYNLSKHINNPCGGGYSTMEQLQEMAKGKKLKSLKGLSNGSIVDIYVGIGDDEVEIYRPNPNAAKVYKPFESLEKELHFRKNHWYL